MTAEMSRKKGHYRLPHRLISARSDLVHVEEPYWRYDPHMWRTMCGRELPAGSGLWGKDVRPVSCEKCRERIAERVANWSSLLDDRLPS